MASPENSPLVAALLGSKKAPRKSASKSASKAAPAPIVAAPAQEYKPPSMAERMKERARYAKLDATSDYVAGRISSAQHDKAHARANHVLRNAHTLARDGKRK